MSKGVVWLSAGVVVVVQGVNSQWRAAGVVGAEE